MVEHDEAYLDVPYAEKDAAKAAGAYWDPRVKRWYAPHGLTPELMHWRAPDTPVPKPEDLVEDDEATANDVGWCSHCHTYQTRGQAPVLYFSDWPAGWRHACPACSSPWGLYRVVKKIREVDAVQQGSNLPWGWWLVATCLHNHAIQRDSLDHLSCGCQRAYEYLGVPVVFSGHSRSGGETDFRFDYVVYQTASGDMRAFDLGNNRPEKPTRALLQAATNKSGRVVPNLGRESAHMTVCPHTATPG